MSPALVPVEVPDDAGGLAPVLSHPDAAHLDIEFMYAFSAALGRRAVVIIRFTDPDRAIGALLARGINVIAPTTLLQG